MTAHEIALNLGTSTARPRRVRTSWLLAALAFSALLSTSVSLASQTSGPASRPAHGRALAPAGTHGVRPGKQRASIQKFVPAGVRPGKQRAPVQKFVPAGVRPGLIAF